MFLAIGELDFIDCFGVLYDMVWLEESLSVCRFFGEIVEM